MKIATDIEQSKALAKILPAESADMHYLMSGANMMLIAGNGTYMSYLAINAWSLSALLDCLRCKRGEYFPCIFPDQKGTWYVGVDKEYEPTYDTEADDPIDACVKMVKQLYKDGLI